MKKLLNTKLFNSLIEFSQNGILTGEIKEAYEEFAETLYEQLKDIDNVYFYCGLGYLKGEIISLQSELLKADTKKKCGYCKFVFN